MSLLTRKRLRELKKLEYILKKRYNQHLEFKRIYESNNKKKDDDREEIIVLSDSDIIHFDNISKDVVDMLVTVDFFDKTIFNNEKKTFTINTYLDLLDTIHYLIDILEFDIVDRNTLAKVYRINQQPSQN